MIWKIFRYIFIKAFIKKVILACIFFVFTYLGLEDLGVLQSAVGTQNFEMTQEISIIRERQGLEYQRALLYRISNTGYRPITIMLEVNTRRSKPQYLLGNVFKIVSNTKNQQALSIKEERPYGNQVVLDIKEIPPGLGLEILFPDKSHIDNYLNGIRIEAVSPPSQALVRHEKNRSPFSIMLLRCALLLAMCMATSVTVFSFLGALFDGVLRIGGYENSH